MPGSTPHKGRGASFNPHPRYLAERREAFDDGWTDTDGKPPPLSTTVTVEQARTIITNRIRDTVSATSDACRSNHVVLRGWVA